MFFSSCGNQNSSSVEESVNEKLPVANVSSQQSSGGLLGDSLGTLREYKHERSDWLKEVTFSLIDSFEYDFSNDGIDDVVSLHRISSYTNVDDTSFENEDPGDYHLVKITDGKTKEEYEFFNGDGWIKNYYLDELPKDDQGFKSDYFVHYSSGKNNLLIFEGYTYGSGSSTRTIINFYDNEPVLIYNANKKIKAVNITNDGLSVVINEAAAEEKSIADEEDVYRVDKWLNPIE